MRPYQHARASAARSGRHWREDLEIHEFIDGTKAACADLRHRMILHSVDLGAELAARAFPDRGDIRGLVRDHVIEDLGHERTLGDWLSHCDLDRLPRCYPGALPVSETALIAGEQERLGLADPSGPRAVLEILALPTVMAPACGHHAWCILGNSYGPFVVRRILGPPVELLARDGRSVVFDHAASAEAMIHALFRAIPEMRTVVMALRMSHQQETSRGPHVRTTV